MLKSDDTTLVTGATGLVGAAIVQRLLADGRKVRAVMRTARKCDSTSGSVETVVADLTDAARVRAIVTGCAVVYHSAGCPSRWRTDARRYEEDNVVATDNVVAASIATGVRRLVYTSAQDTFDLDRNTFDESTRASDLGLTAFARSKIEAQRIVDKAGVRGLSTISLHPALIFGPTAGQPSMLNALLRGLAASRIPWIPPGGLAVVYSGDVAHGHVLAEKHGADGHSYLLAESFQSIKQIALEVHRISGARLPAFLPGLAAELAIQASTRLARVRGVEPAFTDEHVSILRRLGRPNAMKAQLKLGWRPIAFRDALASLLTRS